VDLDATGAGGAAALTWLDRGFDIRRRWSAADGTLALRDISRLGPVVAYLVRDDALWIWVVDRGVMHQRRVGVSRATLARHAARLAHMMTLQGGAPRVHEAAQALARDIWWPIAGLLAPGGDVAPRVALVLDPVLQGVPFALLPWAPDDDSLVVDRTALVLCPSLSACASERSHPAATFDRVAVLHAGQGGPGFAPLPAAREEAERTGRRYAGATVELATEHAFISALAHSDLVHFSGHAAADERYPSRSRLLLAVDAVGTEPVPIGRLLGGTVRTRLAVLSACRTSRAEARRGEGGTGVAGEFLRAGVRDVIAAYWDVKDDVSSETMDFVHEALASGAAPWDAVRLAQQRVRASADRHPRDWAGYVAFTSVAISPPIASDPPPNTSAPSPITSAATSAADPPQRSHQ
jgi:CHAT domain-containing protein